LVLLVVGAGGLLESHYILVLDIYANVALLFGGTFLARRAAIEVGFVEDWVEGCAVAGRLDHFVDELFVVHVNFSLETLDFSFDVVVVVEL
jgi:hypothetical protein